MQKLECVSEDGLRKMVANLAPERGDQGKLAKKIGVDRATLSFFLNGCARVGRKIPAFFGLEPRMVYVRKNNKRKTKM